MMNHKQHREAMAEKNNRVRTPKVTCQWAKLDQPDQYGKYSITLLYDPSNADHQAQLKAFEKRWDDEYKRACMIARKDSLKCDAKPWRAHEVDGKPTGQIAFSVDQKASHTDAKGKVYEFSVAVFRADGKTRWNWDEHGLIGNGSTVKAVFDWNAHGGGPGSEFGLGRRLRAIQVIDHVEYDGGFGFEPEEGSTLNEDGEPINEDLFVAEPAGAAPGDAYLNKGDDELPF